MSKERPPKIDESATPEAGAVSNELAPSVATDGGQELKSKERAQKPSSTRSRLYKSGLRTVLGVSFRGR